MSSSYRSTSVKQAGRHCPAVLDFLDAGTPYDRRLFEVGVAAHACLQAIGEATNRADRVLESAEVDRAAGSVAAALVASGRTFDGKAEPPLAADSAWRGRDLALQWVTWHPMEPGATYENGLAMDAAGKACPYGSPAARYRGILDVRQVVDDGDEEASWKTVLVRDYKSAWNEGEEALDGLQLRGYAVLAWLDQPDAKVIRLQVGNLRLSKLWSRDLVLDDEGLEVLRRWRDDLLATLDAYDQPGARRPVPGIGCAGCPFIDSCPDAKAHFDSMAVPGTREGRATAYAVTLAWAHRLQELVRRDTTRGPVEIAGGEVGWLAREQRCAAEGAYGLLWEAWQRGDGVSHGDALGLLRALAPGVTAMESAAKTLYPSKADRPLRDDLIEQLTGTTLVRRFDIYPKANEQKGEAA